MPRKPTHADAELLLRLYELRRDPELRRARKWFISEFKPGGWDDIKASYLSHTDEDRWFRMTFSYWDMVGAMVNRGVLHEELFFDAGGEHIVTWDRCVPWIADARADLRPTYLYQLERMVEAHRAFRARTIAEYQARKTAKSSTSARPKLARAARKR